MHLLLSSSSRGLLIIITSHDDDAPCSVFNLVSLSIICCCWATTLAPLLGENFKLLLSHSIFDIVLQLWGKLLMMFWRAANCETTAKDAPCSVFNLVSLSIIFCCWATTLAPLLGENFKLLLSHSIFDIVLQFRGKLLMMFWWAANCETTAKDAPYSVFNLVSLSIICCCWATTLAPLLGENFKLLLSHSIFDIVLQLWGKLLMMFWWAANCETTAKKFGRQFLLDTFPAKNRHGDWLAVQTVREIVRTMIGLRIVLRWKNGKFLSSKPMKSHVEVHIFGMNAIDILDVCHH